MSEIDFGQARGAALAEIAGALFDDEGYPVACAWQDAHGDDHVAAYCNLLSHLESLAEFLSYASWCDDVTLRAGFDDSEGAERLFRYYTTAFLLVDQCFADCLAILKAASGGEQRLGVQSTRITDFVNHVWKHRGSRRQGTSTPAFHSFNHHGPYQFEDLGPIAEIPDDGRYVALGHWPPSGCGPVPIVVPSLGATIQALATELAAITTLLSDPAVLQRVVESWGSSPAQ